MGISADQQEPRGNFRLSAADEPQATVYRLAAFAAFAAVAAISVVGNIESKGHGAYFFPETAFYAIVAQILPVLFLTFAVERRFFSPSRTHRIGFGALLAFGLVVLSAAFAELFALLVVGIEDPSRELRTWATLASAAGITGALVLIAGQATIDSGLLDVFIEVLQDPRGHLARERPFGWLALILLGIPMVAAAVWGSYVGNTNHMRQIVAAVSALAVLWLWLRISIVGGRALARLLRRAWTRLRGLRQRP